MPNVKKPLRKPPNSRISPEKPTRLRKSSTHRMSLACSVPQFFRLYDDHNAGASAMQGNSIYTQVANDMLVKHLKGEMKRNETFNLLQDNLAMSKVLKGD
jgi:hypothetical protein